MMKHQISERLPLTLEVNRGAFYKHAIRDATGYAILESGMGCYDDADYLVHAANAYPKLVEALRNEMLALVRMQAEGSSRLLDWKDGTRYSADRMRALLRELGEAE